MGKRGNISRALTLAAICFAALFCLSRLSAAAEDHFAPLKTRLISDGFSARTVMMAYRLEPVPYFRTVAQTLRMRESKADYDQFLYPVPMARARQFAGRYEDILTRAEERYGVDRFVIVAILLVETQLGQYTGRVPTLGVLSTFALMDRKSNRDRVWAMLLPRDRRRWERDAFDKKLTDRAQWAYAELCALFQWTEAQSANAQSFRGSVMGAIGWPQFLPSSILRYGVDGDGDGRIDLFEPEDAIFSVANYLRGHGWCDALDRESRERVIYTYNHSRPYVETILAVADRLRPSERFGSLSPACR